jgi:hypothetical protein
LTVRRLTGFSGEPTVTTRTALLAIIALDLDTMNTPKLVAFTRGICKALTNNANFTAADLAKLPVAVADLGTSATTLETTHTNRPTNPSKANTTLELDQANTLRSQIKGVAAVVQFLANTKANGDLTLAQSIITSAGFKLKKTGAKPAKVFSVTSPAKTVAQLHVPPDPNDEIQLVKYSGDGGKTFSLWIVVHSTSITISALKSGTEYNFYRAISPRPAAKRGKQTLTAGTEDLTWSDFVSCMIL